MKGLNRKLRSEKRGNLSTIWQQIQKSGIDLDKISNLQQMAHVLPKDTQILLRNFTSSIERGDKESVDEFYDLMGEEYPPVRVTVTGASGQIGYALLFRIARSTIFYFLIDSCISGQMLGPEQPVILQLLELPQAMKALEGVVMELQDCAFPLLHSVVQTDDPNRAFEGTDFALLVGAKPRTKGMERGDLLKENAKIFKVQGKALNDNASEDVRVIVVGNPANTNALITSHYAPKIKPSQITAMTRLDHNRGVGMLAEKTGAWVGNIEKFAIWGNHSATQYPDISHTTIEDKPAKDMIDEKWYKETFIPSVQQRGAAIINARGASRFISFFFLNLPNYSSVLPQLLMLLLNTLEIG